MLHILIGFVVGACLGFLLCALVSANDDMKS